MSALSGRGLRLTAYVGEDDVWHHRPVYSEIVVRARTFGLAGASVFRGIEGFGAASIVHTSRILELSSDLPLVVVIIDEASKIKSFLPQVEEIVDSGLITLDPVDIVKYAGESRAGP
jgi:PII-like signaling protein